MRWKRRVLCFASFLFATLMFWYMSSVMHGRPPPVRTSTTLSPSFSNKQTRSTKYILLYTTLFGSIPWRYVPYNYSFTDLDGKSCPVSDCELTYDKNKLSKSDLVVFHGRDLQTAQELRKLSNFGRHHDQVWLYFMHESPVYSYTKFPEYEGVFNWTATYRSDSDALVTYHYYKELESSDNRFAENTNFAKGKTNLVSWVNSHCDESRIAFITELRKYTQLDVYGGCSRMFKPQTRPCPRGPECLLIQKEYKFYLAIENSFCTDYITEKYWLNALEVGLVPIVFGNGNYRNSRIAIPGSYINVKDFKTLKQLGDYINYLDKNDKAYNEYHQWRYKYKLYPHNSMCVFCKAAHEQKPPRKTVDLEKFWGLGNCDLRKSVLNAMVNESKTTTS